MKSQLMLGLLFVLVFLLSAGLSNASESQSGHISNILVNADGKAFFNQSGTRTSIASCQAASVPNRWAFDVNTAKGQAMLSLVLSAYSLGKSVQVYGIGECSDWPDTETVSYVEIVD